MNAAIDVGLMTEMLADFPVPVRDFHIGGSAAICGGGNDVDIIVLQDLPLEFGQTLDAAMQGAGWSLCGQESYDSAGMFMAYRKGKYNAIVVDHAEYYRCWEKARNVCLALPEDIRNDRDWRVKIHAIICDGDEA